MIAIGIFLIWLGFTVVSVACYNSGFKKAVTAPPKRRPELRARGLLVIMRGGR